MNLQADNPRVAEVGATLIKEGFEAYQQAFRAITRRARSRFEQRDWRGAQQDGLERLDLYNRILLQVVSRLRELLEKDIKNRLVWAAMKARYSQLIAGQGDFELAETFFNSTTRRIFATVGVDAKIEFVDPDFEAAPHFDASIFNTYTFEGSWKNLVLEILRDYDFGAAYDNPELDAGLAAAEIEKRLDDQKEPAPAKALECIKPVFYRNKGAYIIGRIRLSKGLLPVVFSLRHNRQGVYIDAVLLTENEVSIIFSFTRSYFQVEAAHPQHLIVFLKTIMPLKRIAELYISIGYNKHGKTELYRDLLQHLKNSTDQFQAARGEKGMVMLVFTLPSYDVVFKVIRDRFFEPKTTTRQEVMDRYQLVFKHDRAGRLVDAQEFEHLRFERSRFSESLLQELLEGAPNSVTVEGDYVAIKHLYIERRLAPLNLFLNEVDEAVALEVVSDYGYSIKDLAATNIFPGDILLKNFGVTRHGRVVFYDYDELCLLNNCRFRPIPGARSFSDDFEAEPWFYVGPNDIFPEEFKTFLGLSGKLRQAFLEVHGDLFEVEFWRSMQAMTRNGQVADIIPYRLSKRLRGNTSS